MPELPEVEKIRHVEIRKPKLVSGKGTLRRVSRKEKEKFIRGLTGEKFINVERRAKNLVFKLSHEKIILAHLKMSGQFVYKASAGTKTVMGGHPIELSEKELPNKHTHITFKLERGTLYYNDTRMFGYLLYYPSIKAFETANHFSTYGLEPVSKRLFHIWLGSSKII